ncbi:hypothetical protein [Marmoricola sp. URHB0036]|uniref:hypothetical protein n=1 Tax=Marmoricola sp. URHB0036 TaxID=1298863 RepID=UPI000480501A|nr:hypothetical protein [Marmoricola sp. URHB0036]
MAELSDFESLAFPFARGLLDKSRASSNPELSKFQRARLAESIAVDIRKLCDIAFPAARRPSISVTAKAVADQGGIDLSRETWHSQPRFDPGRIVFHYEHVQPVSAIRATLNEAMSPAHVVAILSRELQLAWITKDEDARLTALKYRSQRPDPVAAYAEAGITLCNPIPMASQVGAFDVTQMARPGLLAFLDVVLQEDVLAQDSHESECAAVPPAPSETCNCRLGRRLAEDATAKRRILSRLNERGDDEIVDLVASYLAFPYRTHPGHLEEWLP